MIVPQRYAENNNKTTKHTNLKYVNNLAAICNYSAVVRRDSFWLASL